MSDSEDEVDQHQFKVILLGDGAVGKTSIAMRFCNNHFAQQYKQTIGLDFFMKRLVLPGNTQVAMQVWDIGGQSIGGKMIKNYIYGAHAVLLCYDITDKDSFQDLEDWYRLVTKTFAKEGKMPYVGLVGNKTDLAHSRVVSRDKHNLFAEENDTHSFFMSAKNGDMVNSCLYRIAADLSGITLTKTECDIQQRPVEAQIVDHQRHDPSEPRPAKIRQEGKCIVC